MTLDEINQQLDQIDKTINTLDKAAAPGWWSVENAMTISSLVLLFGFAVICLATWVVRSGTNAEEVLRIFGTILIITGSVFLVVAGYTNTQIAPVIGLLGTIVGYLLGKETRGNASGLGRSKKDAPGKNDQGAS